MPVIKRVIFTGVFFVVCLTFAAAGDSGVSVSKLAGTIGRTISINHGESKSSGIPKIEFYAGINPLALVAFIPKGIGTALTGLGVLSGQEFGLSLYGGLNLAKAHSLEVRLSSGPADAVIWDTQLQLGYLWYPLRQFLDWNAGFCAGVMLRQFFWNNGITKQVVFNFTPELLLGWRFKARSLLFDLRAGWNMASVTWTTIPHVKPAAQWTKFPYNLTFTFGIAWLFG